MKQNTHDTLHAGGHLQCKKYVYVSVILIILSADKYSKFQHVFIDSLEVVSNWLPDCDWLQYMVDCLFHDLQCWNEFVFLKILLCSFYLFVSQNQLTHMNN